MFYICYMCLEFFYLDLDTYTLQITHTAAIAQSIFIDGLRGENVS